MLFFDSHCHLTAHQFSQDRAEVIVRAVQAGVRMLTIGTDASTSRQAADLAREKEHVYAAVGIHPNDAHRASDADYAVLRELCSEEKVRAIGETGLDFYHNTAPREVQEEHFRRHIALCEETGLPLILHARESGAACLDILEPFLKNGGKAVWHCFIAGKKEMPALLERALGLGLYLGISGLVTFEDQKPLRSVIRQIPDRHLLLDTDSPYLIPRPRTLDRNEPAQAVRIAEELATLRGVTVADIARITTRNACEFLNLPVESDDGPDGHIAYPIRNSLYLNLTARCNNNCTFCGRNQSYVVKGHDITLAHEPGTEEVLAAMGDFLRYDEVVFCGYGEPTMRLEVLKQVARQVKKAGQKVRLNTNGLASLEYNRDVATELAGLVDTVSISLNSAEPGQYLALCRSKFGDQAYPAMLDFARACLKAGIRTILTVVDMQGIDIEAAHAVAENVGAEFRVRSFIDAG